LAVFFIVLALDNFGFAFGVALVVVVATGFASSAPDDDFASSSDFESDPWRASINSLTRLNLSSPHAFFKNSWPA
jgi:hypothetical protein